MVNFFGLVLITLIFNGAVYAASFNVSPIKIYLSQHVKIEALTLLNHEEQPLTLHLEIKKWSQKEGQDVFEDTKEVIAVPHICTLNPQGIQTIKVALKTSPDVSIEKSYRLFITEIPHKDPLSAMAGKGLMFALKMSIPVFITPLKVSESSTPQLQILPHQDSFKLINTGTSHVHIRSVHAPASMKEPQEVIRYVLPDQHFVLEGIDADKIKGTKLVAHVNNQEIIVDVPTVP